jgi:L-rhamnose isomerase
MAYRIPDELIAKENAKLARAQEEDYAALGRQPVRSGAPIEDAARNGQPSLWVVRSKSRRGRTKARR